MFLLGVVHLIFTKPNSKKEKDGLVKGWDQHFLMYKIKQYYGYNVWLWGGMQRVSQNKGNQRAIKLNAWIWGFSLTLKSKRLPINQP
jgi:hypothetical protein